MVSGNITSRVTTLKALTLKLVTKRVWHSRVLNTLTLVLSITAVTTGVVYDALGYTDMLPEFGGDTAYSDDFFVGRVGGVATYRNSNFFGLVDGLNFAVQYLGKNERDTARRSNGDGVGGSISYEYEGFGIVGAYGAADRTNLQEAQPLGNGKKLNSGLLV
ncbi:outer membrane protein F [Escherichia coli]|nr:outer membrane protein F [Escherichia coli]